MTRARDLADGTFANGVDVTGTVTSDGIRLGDNEHIYAGAGNDLDIYHDGSDSYVTESGAGSLYIGADSTIALTDAAVTENKAQFITGGAVNLFYDNSKKFETTSYGVDISGSVVADTQTTNASGATTANFSLYQNFVWTLTGNVTLSNPTTEKVGQSGFFVFIQDATGGRTVSLGTDYETAGGSGLTLSSAASTTDIVPYVVAASGRILLGAPQLNFS